MCVWTQERVREADAGQTRLYRFAVAALFRYRVLWLSGADLCRACTVACPQIRAKVLQSVPTTTNVCKAVSSTNYLVYHETEIHMALFFHSCKHIH